MTTETIKKYAGREGEGTFRAMTFEEAKALSYGQHVWFRSIQGDAKRFKVNGAPKTWKRDTTRIEIPAKYGLYEYATFDALDIASGRLLVVVEAE